MFIMSAKDYFKEGVRKFGRKLKEDFITTPKEFFKGNWNKLKERRKKLINSYGKFGLFLKRFKRFFFCIPLIFEIVLFFAGLLTTDVVDTLNFKEPIWIYWTLIGVGIWLSISLIVVIIFSLIVSGGPNHSYGLVETNDN